MNEANGVVSLEDIEINFGDFAAVKRLNLLIEHGEFFTLLGPSGCGKTTLLRSVAGFVRQSYGSIRIGGTVVDNVPAYQRDAAMVFQSYAIFPHLTVKDNVAYGLKSRRVPSAESNRRVAEALKMVDLAGYEDRFPRNLSGGQQQRVVIARAIVTRPKVLLMDEPLANLDAKLRVRLRNDLKRLQKELGTTTIYVTHDQDEALSLSDRVAVMSGGHMLQVGSPQEIYNQPAAIGVAEFIGDANFFRSAARIGDAEVLIGDRTFRLPRVVDSTEPWVGFRPHKARLRRVTEPREVVGNSFLGRVVGTTYLGTHTSYQVDVGQPRMAQVDVHSEGAPITPGDSVFLEIDPEDLMVFRNSSSEREML